MCRFNGIQGARTTRRERRRAIANVKPSSKAVAEPMPEWIVVDFDGRGFKCERCGATEQHSTPRGVSRMDSFSLRGQAFAIDHAGCEEQQ